MGPHVVPLVDKPWWESNILGGALRGRDLDALIAACRAVRQPPRSTVLQAPDDTVLFMIRGSAKSCFHTSEGDEVITALHGPGHAAGLLVVLGHALSGTDLVSIEQVDALAMPGRDLRGLMAEYPGITSACLETLAEQHAAAAGERNRFAGTSIPQRVAARLCELATRWGESEGSRVHISLPLTQEELAAWSGASRESVAKVLHGMRRAGLLETGRRSLTILDVPRLRERCRTRVSDDPRGLLVSSA